MPQSQVRINYNISKSGNWFEKLSGITRQMPTSLGPSRKPFVKLIRFLFPEIYIHVGHFQLSIIQGII